MRKAINLWTQKNGKRIRVCDMEDDHLLNTMNMLIRRSKTRKHAVDMFYVTCGEPGGDIAMDCLMREQEEAWDASWERFLPPIYFAMQRDASRRGLEFEWHDKEEIRL